MPKITANKSKPADRKIGKSLTVAGLCLPAILVLIPVLIVLWRAAEPPGESWAWIVENRLPGYLRHTVVLVGLVTFFAILFGVPAAWFVSVYRFPGRLFFELALLVPLAMPGFISAVAYVDTFENIVPFYIWIRENFGIDAFIKSQEIAPWFFAVLVLSSTLFPYVYLSCRAIFARQAVGALEASRMLGASGFRSFCTVALPMARPAVVAGGSLAAMETINDYGVVSHFGLSPLTPGIFRAWNEGDLPSSMRLAIVLMLVVMITLVFERWQRGRKKFTSDDPDIPLSRRPLNSFGVLSAWLVCGLPLLLGFVIPCYRLVRWTLQSWAVMDWEGNFAAAKNSFVLAGGAAFLVLFGSLLLVAGHRAWPSRVLRSAQKIGVLGYAYPSALVAVGVGALMSTLAFDFPGWSTLALSASCYGLMFAYFIRFLAVGIQPLAAGVDRLSPQLHEAGRLLGSGPLRSLRKIDLPLLRPVMLAAITLAFLDVFKELTMTLVLRPFDFETLATLTFRLTDEGRIPEAALPGLMMVSLSLFGLIPLLGILRPKSR